MTRRRVSDAKLIEQAFRAHVPGIEGGPQIDRFPHLDALLQLRLLELHADAILQAPPVAGGIHPEHRDRAALGPPQSFDALERRGLARAVRADQAEDLAFFHGQRHIVDRDGSPVGLANGADVDDGGHGVGFSIPATEEPAN